MHSIFLEQIIMIITAVLAQSVFDSNKMTHTKHKWGHCNATVLPFHFETGQDG